MNIKLMAAAMMPFIISSTQAFTLEKGIGVNESNEVRIWTESVPYAIADQGLDQLKIENDYTVAFFELPEVVYGVSDELNLVKVRKEDRKLLSHWPLTPWAYRAALSSERAASSDAKDTAGEYLNEQDYWENEVPDEFKIGSRVFWSNYFEDHHSNERYGCLGRTPLRYGAVNGDNLLVLFLRNNITFFSPLLGKTVFEYNWFNYDGDPKVDRHNNDPMVIDGLEELKGKAPQILSYSGFENMVREPLLGWTSLSKVFIDDFNNDNKADILLWRKFYSSRLAEDALKGYRLSAENWLHYQRDATGEYLPQDTSPETIQSWLSAKNLTWQKGFPSQSECVGEEGKLIPEMHDPLLNDPDVLN